MRGERTQLVVCTLALASCTTSAVATRWLDDRLGNDHVPQRLVPVLRVGLAKHNCGTVAVSCSNAVAQLRFSSTVLTPEGIHQTSAPKNGDAARRDRNNTTINTLRRTIAAAPPRCGGVPPTTRSRLCRPSSSSRLRRLARLQRADTEGRPDIVEADLCDGFPAIPGHDDPELVSIDLSSIPFAVADPDRAHAGEGA